MVDFRKSFSDGLNSAKSAALSRNEIKNVFLELNKQLGEATDGRLSIQIKEQNYIVGVAKRLSGLLDDSRKDYVLSASIHGMASVDIARWHQASSGYPCRIYFDGVSLSCEDRQSLEAGLSAMLSNSEVGEKIFNLLESNPPLKMAEDEEG